MLASEHFAPSQAPARAWDGRSSPGTLPMSVYHGNYQSASVRRRHRIRPVSQFPPALCRGQLLKAAMHPLIVANSRPGEGADGTTCIQRQIFETTTQKLLGPQNRDQTAGDGTYMGAVQSAKLASEVPCPSPLVDASPPTQNAVTFPRHKQLLSQSGAGPSRLFEERVHESTTVAHAGNRAAGFRLWGTHAIDGRLKSTPSFQTRRRLASSSLCHHHAMARKGGSLRIQTRAALHHTTAKSL